MQSLWRLMSAPCCFAELRDGAVADLARKEEHLSDKDFAEVHSLKRLPVCNMPVCNTFALKMALVDVSRLPTSFTHVHALHSRLDLRP